MLSVTIYTIIFAVVAYMIAILKKKDNIEDYGPFSVAIIAFMEYIFPYLMLEDKTSVIYVGFILELILYIYIFVMENELKSREVRPFFIFCIMQPFSTLAILQGSQLGLIVSMAILVIVVHLRLYLRYRARKKMGNVSASSDTRSAKETRIKAPVFTAFSKEKLKRADYIVLLVIMLVYGFLVFNHIGTKLVPQTERMMNISDGTNEITLDLGQSVYVSKIWVWLGYENTSCAYSWYSFDEGKWVILDGDYQIDGVFRWHDYNVDLPLQHIGMVFQREPAVIHEVVVVDGWGNVIQPVNASDYPELFDEQDTFTAQYTYENNSMFDEVYHARTAYEFINDYPIYEYTHPPLGKTIISLGIRMFGMNPFGWRFMSGVFGVLLVPLTFALAYEITGKRRETILTTILMCAGFMNYSLSRIATIDIFVAVFALFMFLFMLSYVHNLSTGLLCKKQVIRLGLAGLSTGLAIATKWTGIYAAAGLAIMLFYGLYCHYVTADRKNILKELCQLALVCTLFFVVLPLAIYTLSYIEFIQVDPSKGLVKTTFDNISMILNYHNGVKSSHPYESEWYQWLIDYRPLLDACNYVGLDTYTVTTFINPLICIVGLVAVVYCIYIWRIKADVTAGSLVIAYLSVLMPWLLVHRTVFIYQYFISMLIMVFMIGYASMHFIKAHPRFKYMYVGIVVLALCLLIFFFPVISGMPIKYEFVNKHMEWLSSWVFA